MSIPIETYGIDEIPCVMKALGQPSFRTSQLTRWLFKQGVTDYDHMTNLSASLRSQLAQEYPLSFPVVIDKQVSIDGSRKYVLQLRDGSLVETVGMPSVHSSEQDGGSRLTVCFSTQVGCAMNCAFCATGNEGEGRNLLPGEMVQQILVVQNDFGNRVTNAVAMGQGEPFLNYDNLVSALATLNSEDGCGIGSRHITVSTCGITQRIHDFARLGKQYTLAVSLHSAVQSIRDTLMPRMASTPLPQLKECLQDYTAVDNRRVSLEYLMIGGVNDTPECLNALMAFCNNLLCHVNLLAMNSIESSPWSAPQKGRLQQWQTALDSSGIPATIRNSRGQDIDGACGQLKNKLQS